MFTAPMGLSLVRRYKKEAIVAGDGRFGLFPVIRRAMYDRLLCGEAV